MRNEYSIQSEPKNDIDRESIQSSRNMSSSASNHQECNDTVTSQHQYFPRSCEDKKASGVGDDYELRKYALRTFKSD
jgi:hypothetical protein